jgi:translation initiation factor IF-2
MGTQQQQSAVRAHSPPHTYIKPPPGGPDAPDLTESLTNLGINLTAVVVLTFLLVSGRGGPAEGPACCRGFGRRARCWQRPRRQQQVVAAASAAAHPSPLPPFPPPHPGARPPQQGDRHARHDPRGGPQPPAGQARPRALAAAHPVPRRRAAGDRGGRPGVCRARGQGGGAPAGGAAGARRVRCAGAPAAARGGGLPRRHAPS